jgi:FkbM family methyltransferase
MTTDSELNHALTSILEHSCFEEFGSSPLGLIDVGARWGVSKIFLPFAKVIDVLAFEPEADEAKNAEKQLNHDGWAHACVLPLALAKNTGNVTLRLLRHRNNSSVYAVRDDSYHRYQLTGFELDKTVVVPSTTLDDIVFGPDGNNHRWGEIIKIDAQGSELEILRGAERCLREHSTALLCETAFFSPYKGAPLFSQIETFLRKRGYVFYGFHDIQHRSTKQLSKSQAWGRERYMQADALFIRDPFESAVPQRNFNDRAYKVLFLVAIMFRYYDFALELAKNELAPRTLGTLTDHVNTLARVDVQHLRNVLASASKSLNPLISFAKLVDEYRDLSTFNDVPKA